VRAFDYWLLAIQKRRVLLFHECGGDLVAGRLLPIVVSTGSVLLIANRRNAATISGSPLRSSSLITANRRSYSDGFDHTHQWLNLSCLGHEEKQRKAHKSFHGSHHQILIGFTQSALARQRSTDLAALRSVEPCCNARLKKKAARSGRVRRENEQRRCVLRRGMSNASAIWSNES